MPSTVPPLDDLLEILPAGARSDTIEMTAFDDDEVVVRRVRVDVDNDRFGLEGFFVPGWDSMTDDEKSACAIALVLSLGDELCERELSTDTTELTMTLDDVADDDQAALRRFAVSAQLPNFTDALIAAPDATSIPDGSPLGEASNEDVEIDDDALEMDRVFTLFGEIEVRDGVALTLYARVPAQEDAHDRAISFLSAKDA